MRLRLVVGAVVPLLLLIGCGTQIGLSGQAREDYLKSIKPYGAHWVKEGMTREMRLHDLGFCGDGNFSLGSGFSDALIRAETLPTDVVSSRSYNKELINNPEAEERLGKKRALCMRDKGYIWLEKCDARCLHP
jgi:hypothetical protein